MSYHPPWHHVSRCARIHGDAPFELDHSLLHARRTCLRLSVFDVLVAERVDPSDANTYGEAAKTQVKSVETGFNQLSIVNPKKQWVTTTKTESYTNTTPFATVLGGDDREQVRAIRDYVLKNRIVSACCRGS